MSGAGARVAGVGVIREILPPDTALAYLAMRELRPDLGSADQFARQVDGVQRQEGYRLVGAFDHDDEHGAANALAVAGFRVRTSLSWGRHVYVDDLSTVPQVRRRGLAGGLLDWIHDEAARLGCAQVHLDSGVGPDRQSAHRLYLNAGYAIGAHHFARRGH